MHKAFQSSQLRFGISTQQNGNETNTHQGFEQDESNYQHVYYTLELISIFSYIASCDEREPGRSTPNFQWKELSF